LVPGIATGPTETVAMRHQEIVRIAAEEAIEAGIMVQEAVAGQEIATATAMATLEAGSQLDHLQGLDGEVLVDRYHQKNRIPLKRATKVRTSL